MPVFTCLFLRSDLVLEGILGRQLVTLLLTRRLFHITYFYATY